MTRTTITTAAGKTTPTYGYLLNNDTVETLIEMVNEHASALDTAGVPPGTLGVETKTSGALALDHKLSYITVANTVAFTLADGTVAGQTKQIECQSTSGTPLGTLTVTTMDTAGGGASATFVFTAAGQRLELEWSGTAWHITNKVRAGRQAVVLGTTVLTGYVMFAVADLSVTGTVHSTTTKGFPAGQIPGETFYADVTTAASSALGDIAITAKTTVGVAATSWANIGNTSTTKDSCASFRWDGAAWQALSFTAGAGTATLS